MYASKIEEEQYESDKLGKDTLVKVPKYMGECISNMYDSAYNDISKSFDEDVFISDEELGMRVLDILINEEPEIYFDDVEDQGKIYGWIDMHPLTAIAAIVNGFEIAN